MTSNLASEEIASYAQDLRREENNKPPLVNETFMSGKLIFLFKFDRIFYSKGAIALL